MAIQPRAPVAGSLVPRPAGRRRICAGRALHFSADRVSRRRLRRGASVLILLFVVVFVPMLIEAARAARNERLQRARGGVEPAGDVYELMRFAYPAAFLIMLTEGFARGAPSSGIF